MNEKMLHLKDRFVAALKAGELGIISDQGIVFTLQEFKMVFADIETGYINSFLPTATLELGMKTLTYTQFLFRLRKGAYLVQPQLLDDF